jgi:hypothetical protein
MRRQRGEITARLNQLLSEMDKVGTLDRHDYRRERWVASREALAQEIADLDDQGDDLLW